MNEHTFSFTISAETPERAWFKFWQLIAAGVSAFDTIDVHRTATESWSQANSQSPRD